MLLKLDLASAERIFAIKTRATAISLKPLRLAKTSIACKVLSRVALCSASNTADVKSNCTKLLVRDTMLNQSALLIARKDLTALLTVKLLAAWSALCSI